MEPIIVLLLLAAVVWVVSGPLRAGAEAVESREAAEIAELEAAKLAKYRELRDLELDRATGKLSDEDHAATEAQLRAEAIAILKRLDALRGESPDG